MTDGTIRAGDGTAISYSVEGAGPWLILSNSLATDRGMWAPQRAGLEHDFTVLTYDTRGHGQSEVSADEFGFDTLAGDVIALMDALGIGTASFAGLSLGGMTGLALALHHAERFETIVCCDARADAPEAYKAMWDANIALSLDGGMEAVAEATLPRWFSEVYRADPANAGEFARIGDMLRATPAEGYRKAARCLQSLDLLKHLGDIDMPVHFIGGALDPAAPVAVMQDMADRVPSARHAVIPDAAHLSNIENPDSFLATLRTALSNR